MKTKDTIPNLNISSINMMKQVYLWPKLEILQLVMPSLTQLSRGLQLNQALEVTKQIYASQNYDKNITFDRLLITFKNILKWNDSCIKL